MTDFEYGLICPDNEYEKVPAPDTVLGYIKQRVGGQSIVSRGHLVPLQKGIGFGVGVMATPDQDIGAATIRVTHPPFKPGGKTTESWTSSFSATERGFNFFTFEFDFEMVPGIWTLEAEADGALLYRVSFQVVDPATVPALTGLCKGDDMLS